MRCNIQTTRARPVLSNSALTLALTLTLFLESVEYVHGNWNSMFSNSEGDYMHYAQSSQSEWLGSSSSIAISVKGCAWSYVSNQDEDAACMENESEDGTTYWYMMANCRRANVVYDVYATDSGSTSCNSGDFKESFVTTGGLAEFIETMSYYDMYSPFGGNDDGYGELPMCESDGNGYYLSVGCTDSGGFAIDTFTDEYCLQRSGQYAELSSINSNMKSMSSCYNAIDYASYLLASSNTCSAMDSSLCTTSGRTSSVGKKSGSSSGVAHSGGGGFLSSMSWANKVKYALGLFLLLASLVMFMGILFTNRRKRRAMMHRKFRQRYSKDGRTRRSRSSKSRSKSRRMRDDGTRSYKSSRSKSRSRQSRSKSKSRLRESEDNDNTNGGYFA